MSNLDIIRGRQVVLPLTNKSGGQRVEGEVVIVDTTTDDSFTRIAAAGSELVIGVVAETIENNAEGRVICGGYVATLDVDAATTRGQYLKTSATAGDATPAAAMDAGVFGIALSAVGGAGQISAYLFGVEGGTGAGDWTLIQDIELGAPAATIDFLAIAGTYKHLKILASLRTDRAASVDPLSIRFNNDGGNNYYSLQWRIRHANSLATEEVIAGGLPRLTYLAAANAAALAFSTVEIFVPDYADSGKHKTAKGASSGQAENTTTNISDAAGNVRWVNTDAITRITLLPALGANFVAASRACLYGIN